MHTTNRVGDIASSRLDSSGQELELRRSGGGELAHYLGGRKVERGAELELLLDGGVWLRGRYEWNGTEARWAGLRVALGGLHVSAPGAWRPAAVLALNPEAILRWATNG
jgi:hypothetical protein